MGGVFFRNSRNLTYAIVSRPSELRKYSICRGFRTTDDYQRLNTVKIISNDKVMGRLPFNNVEFQGRIPIPLRLMPLNYV